MTAKVIVMIIVVAVITIMRIRIEIMSSNGDSKEGGEKEERRGKEKENRGLSLDAKGARERKISETINQEREKLTPPSC